MRVVEAEIRNSSRPGSQAPNAPPALTFGLPGKQMVKVVGAGAVLVRVLNTLPGNPGILPKVKDFRSPTGRLIPDPRGSLPSGHFLAVRYLCERFVASMI
jgi:hypothetical protein